MSAPVIKQLITLVLACYSLSVMAQSGFIWDASNGAITNSPSVIVDDAPV